MKKTELLNSNISAVVSSMGHTDMLTIGDCGLPVRGTEKIDICLKKGIPSFIDTLNTVLSELCVEKAIIAEETRSVSPGMHEEILKALGDKVKIEYVSHEELKKLSESSRAVIRTGECTSFANIILCSGVTF